MKQTCKLTSLIIAYQFAFTACTRTIYNVEYSSKKPKCDTTAGQLHLRIINTGKYGISSLSFTTDSGEIKYSGIKPHDTTCYFRVPSMYINPGYQISLVRVNHLGMYAAGGLLGAVIDRSSKEEKLIKGNYTLLVSLKKRKRGLKVKQFLIEPD